MINFFLKSRSLANLNLQKEPLNLHCADSKAQNGFKIVLKDSIIAIQIKPFVNPLCFSA